jgi:hypothetical protein
VFLLEKEEKEAEMAGYKVLEDELLILLLSLTLLLRTKEDELFVLLLLRFEIQEKEEETTLPLSSGILPALNL